MATSAQVLRPTARVHRWQGHLLWILGAGVIGLSVAGIFTSILHVPRDGFVAVHVAVVALLASAYARWSGIELGRMLRRRWLVGVILGAVIAVLMAFNIVNNETASPRHGGFQFIWDILWLGIAYGGADAVLLNVLPVYALWQASRDLGHTASWGGKIGTAAAALLASLLVTTMYHLGFAEYRNDTVSGPVFGNSLITLSYILSGNPITAFAGHIALHIASVVHGVGSTVTLPPHY